MTTASAALNFSDLRGKVVVLTFIYTRCPLTLLMDRKFGELASKLAAFPERQLGSAPLGKLRSRT